MLTLDLLRCRIEGDDVFPMYLSTKAAKSVKAADALIEMFRAHVGRSRGELDSALDDMAGDGPEYKVYRGLAKTLEEHAVIESDAAADPEATRTIVFESLARLRPVVRRADLMFRLTTDEAYATAAEAAGMSVDELKKTIYADLKENHVVKSFEGPAQPQDLIHRYNTALAQALLYRATDMAFEVHDSYKHIFRYLKLARLMHTIKPLKDGYRVLVNGPVSLFQHSEMYGIGMAKFLPGLLNAKRWRMAARVNTSHAGRKMFRLDSSCGLKSHYRPEREFDSKIEDAFFTKFSRNKKSKWTVHREDAILSLRETVMIPDFVFRHKDGRTAYLEIVGFWTPEYLEKKMAKLSELARNDIVVAVPESLNCSNEDFDGPVIKYKTSILMKNLLPVLDEVRDVSDLSDRSDT